MLCARTNAAKRRSNARVVARRSGVDDAEWRQTNASGNGRGRDRLNLTPHSSRAQQSKRRPWTWTWTWTLLPTAHSHWAALTLWTAAQRHMPSQSHSRTILSHPWPHRVLCARLEAVRYSSQQPATSSLIGILLTTLHSVVHVSASLRSMVAVTHLRFPALVALLCWLVASPAASAPNATEYWRPVLHYSPRVNWINDPVSRTAPLSAAATSYRPTSCPVHDRPPSHLAAASVCTRRTGWCTTRPPSCTTSSASTRRRYAHFTRSHIG